MELINAVIIYFAFGVPLSVLSIYFRSSRFQLSDVFRVVYHLAFWPAMVFIRSVESQGIQFEQPITHTAGESTAGKNLIRQLRLKYMVLDGLVEAWRSATAAADLKLPFNECIEHPNPPLAAKCFQRRNIAKLERHIAGANEDLSKSTEFQVGRESMSLSSESNVPEQPVHDVC